MQQTQLWIGDRWVAPAKYTPLVNPYTGEKIFDIGYASKEQAMQAIETAASAFSAFRKTPIHERADILYRVAELLGDRREEAARIIALEAAKPIKAARGEVERTIQTYRFAAEAVKNLRTETVPLDAAPRGEHHMAYVARKPLGVVTAITPFNFPMNLVAHKVGPAIAAGNTIVLKPAEQTPLSALFLAELFKQAGLPSGVLNIIPGSGEELGEILTTHPKVQFVTFTGSPRVGKLIRAQAGLRRVTLELGSNSPLIIDEGFSETEVERIAAEATLGAFSYNGQVCISVQRVYVHSSLYPAFVQCLVQNAQQLVAGDPMDDATDITALINATAVNRLKQWLANAVAAGAKVECGGTFAGNVMSPTVLTSLPHTTELACEEAFGPIVSVTSFDDWREAIRLANQSKYGLHAGFFTKDVERAFAGAELLESGGVLINQIPTFRVDHMPYGGVKDSGVGREGIKYALEEMTDIKLVAFRTNVY